ncbi:MAG: PdxA family dehydrogenase, partial [Verrucomicrobiales bacterium]
MPPPPSDLPIIALTMGDPAGVGPEICLRALADSPLLQECQLRVFGSQEILQRAAESTGLTYHQDDRLIDIPNVNISAVVAGTVTAATGAASYAYIQAAIDAALAKDVAAVVTAPINKEALHMAGFPFPGHTEMFATRSQSDRWCMMQYSDIITCTFVTVHVGYAEVPALLTKERILEVIQLTHESLIRIRGKQPRIVVCGLN